MLISAFMKSDLNLNVPLTHVKMEKILAKPISLKNFMDDVKKLIVN